MYRDNELLDPAELCELLGADISTVREWMLDGELPYLKRDGSVYFVRDDVNKWLLSQMEKDAGDAGKVSTEKLIVQLSESKSVESFLQIYNQSLQRADFHKFICDLAARLSVSRSDVIRRANITESYGYHIFRGTRTPSRETVIQLAFGFQADIELTQQLLKEASYRSLYPKIPREAVIYYCILNGMSLTFTQNKLSELGMNIIGGGE